jgi:hypothetical protein
VTQEQGYTYLRSFRYERKFLVEDLMPFQVATLVKQHPRMFYAPYPPRHVNNLYLDTPDMVNYFDNVDGATQRRKVRVRWYSVPFGEVAHPILEVKFKDGVVSTKYSYPLSGFQMNENFCDRVFQRAIAESDLPPEARLALRGLRVILFNRYYRHYYATRDGDFRITLDSQLEFYKINGRFGNQFIHRQRSLRDVVVELKYEVEQELQANRVASFFPFRMTRNSKYVQGIERVYF